MDSGSIHRKIELQSPEDFTYLINNVRRAAADSINEAFPPVEGHEDQEDELRVRIEQLVYSVCFLLPSSCRGNPRRANVGVLTRPLAVHQPDLLPRRAKPHHQRAPRRPGHVPLGRRLVG